MIKELLLRRVILENHLGNKREVQRLRFICAIKRGSRFPVAT